MSSHHVVREKQEPALIIANGEACRSELLEDLLAWCPFVVVLDSAIYRVNELNVKADVLLGDFDRDELKIEQIQEEQFPIEIVYTPDQNKTDLQKGIEFLIDRGFPAVNVIWATGRRMDHTFNNIASIVAYKDLIKIVIIDDYTTIYPLSQKPNVFEKWYAKDSIISLLPIGSAGGVTTKNLLYNTDDQELVLGFVSGSSNQVRDDGIVEVFYTSGNLLLMEAHD
ncbi:MAG: thiamine pyrophosphokinase [Spirosomataceae bacterium]|jgi:thiamine pyrophosphokinase